MGRTLAGWSRLMLPLVAFMVILAAWEGGVAHFQIRGWILPAPSAIGAIAYDWRLELLSNTWTTTVETVSGFALAVLLGPPLALAVVWTPLLRRTVYPVLLALQSIPKVALAPLITLWIGLGLWPKVVVVWLVCFFPIVVSTAAGLDSVPKPLLDLMRSMKARRWQVFRRVRIPMAIPHFLTGCKIAVTFAVIGAVIAEFVGSEAGLGYLILTASSQSQTALAFAALAVLTILSMLLYYLVEQVELLILRRMG
jgi:NitT/TauT family transport system permease protein